MIEVIEVGDLSSNTELIDVGVMSGPKGDPGPAGAPGAPGPAGAAGASTALFSYNYNSTTTAPPASNQVRANNASSASVTVIWVNNLDADGRDEKNLLLLANAGDDLFVQDKNNSASHVTYTLSSDPVDNTTYVTYNVSFKNASGTSLVGQSILLGVLREGTVGPQGPPGAPGQGVPTGGATDYVLTKNSPANYDTSFKPATGGVTSVNTRTGAVTGLAELSYVDAHLTDLLDAHDASAISVVPQGQQVGTDVQGAINNLDTRISTMLENGPDYLKSWALFYDDFLGSASITSTGTAVSGQVGVLGWNATANNSGQVAVAASGVDQSIGFVGLQSGTTSASGSAVMLLNANDFSGHPIFIMEWRAHLSALNVVGTDEFSVRFGLGDGGVVLAPTDGYYFELTPADTSWHYRTAKAGVRDDRDSNVVADTNWHKYRIVSDGGGAVTFTIDGANAQVLSNSTMIPVSTDFFGPIAGMLKSLGTAQRQIRFDYFYLLWAVNRP